MKNALSVELADEAALSVVSISVRRAQPIQSDASPIVENSGIPRGLAHERYVFATFKLHGDDNPVPVLFPGRGTTKQGRL